MIIYMGLETTLVPAKQMYFAVGVMTLFLGIVLS